MIDEVLSNANTKMHKAIEALRRELVTIRTGRANPGLVEHIQVDYYGTLTPLNQLASISIPEARLLIIHPWDRQALSAIEKAILKSDLGLNPSSNGNVIRLAIPQLTEERRREIVRVVRRMVEDGRVEIRNMRREAMEKLRGLEKEKAISEDERRRASEQLQRLADSFIAEADQIVQDKETELMQV